MAPGDGVSSLRRASPRFEAGVSLLLLTVGALAVGTEKGQSSAPSRRDKAAPTSRAEENESVIRARIATYFRGRFPIPPDATLTIGPFRPSPFPGYYTTTITLGEGRQRQSRDFYVSKDGRYLIQGNIYTLGADPRREVEREISTDHVPSVGPSGAPVTIVEYADLQCPTCARAQQFLEKELLPKYQGKVRVIFKEYPLVNVHDWALEGSVASACAYQEAPEKYLAYRSLIFQHQAEINASRARDQLLNLAQQAGIDRDKLAPCIDARSTLPRVEKDFVEGQTLAVASTPTFFINGRMVVGAAPQDVYKAVDEALAGK